MYLTRRQRELLDFLQSYTARHRYAPSIAEICRQFKLRSVATVHKHLCNLEKKGLLRRDPRRARGIELRPARRTDLETRLTVAGTFAYGKAIGAVRAPASVVVPKSMVRQAGCFVLEVRDETLLSKGICKGDWLAVSPRRTPKPNELLLVLGKRKRVVLANWRPRGGKGQWVPLLKSPGLPEGADGKASVQGVITGLVRRY